MGAHKRLSFFTQLGDDPSRTFIVLPPTGATSMMKTSSSVRNRFSANVNTTPGINEVDAHTTMFNNASNDGSYILGTESVKLIVDWWRAAVS